MSKITVLKHRGDTDEVKMSNCDMIGVLCTKYGEMRVIKYGANWAELASVFYSSKAYAVKKAKEIICEYVQAYLDGTLK